MEEESLLLKNQGKQTMEFPQKQVMTFASITGNLAMERVALLQPGVGSGRMESRIGKDGIHGLGRMETPWRDQEGTG